MKTKLTSTSLTALRYFRALGDGDSTALHGHRLSGPSPNTIRALLNRGLVVRYKNPYNFHIEHKLTTAGRAELKKLEPEVARLRDELKKLGFVGCMSLWYLN